MGWVTNEQLDYQSLQFKIFNYYYEKARLELPKSNLMQKSKKNSFYSFALGSIRVKFAFEPSR